MYQQNSVKLNDTIKLRDSGILNNSDLLNSSGILNNTKEMSMNARQMSVQTNRYVGEQLLILKQNNENLINENKKLIKACEKYINEAKESHKLRLQIMKLKQKLSSQAAI